MYGVAPRLSEWCIELVATVSFVRWKDFDPATIERAIKALIVELHPGARPVDGRGGDRGRDVRWDSPDGLTIFEIKSYVDRLNDNQKNKIKKSLANASAHQPVSWVLVLPLDHSPAEETWFDELALLYPAIRLEWRGATWLDVEFGKREYLRRMLESESYQLHKLAHEFDKEEAVLAGGMADATARLARLMSRANELSPYWVAQVTLSTDSMNVRYQERYPGAAALDPIAPQPVYHFPPGDISAAEAQQRLNDFHDYGGDIEIDGKYVAGFGIDVSEASQAFFSTASQGTTERLRLTSQSRYVEDLPVIQLVAATASGMPRFRLPLQMDPPTEGVRGLRVRGRDATGTIQVILTMDRPESGRGYRIDIGLKGIAGKLPYTARPAFDIFTHLTDDGDRLELRVNDQPLQYAGDMTTLLAETRICAETLLALEQLQAHAGVLFPVPDNLTYQDARDLAFAAKLLSGQQLRAGNTWLGLTIRHDKLEDFLASDAVTPGALTAEFADYALQLGPHQLRLGTVNVVAPRMALTNLDDLKAAVGTGTEPTARYECINREGVYYRLGPLVAEPETPTG